MKKRIIVLATVFVLLLCSVIPSFAYYDQPDTDIILGGLWYLPESWSFTDSYELRFNFYSSQSGDDYILDIHYTGIYIDSDEQTIEYITSFNDGTDLHHTVYMNGSWLGDGYRQVIITDFCADTTDPVMIYWVDFAEYLLDNAFDITYSNYEQGIEQEGELQYYAGYQEGYQEGVNAAGGFTQTDIDNALNEGYWSGYEEGSDAGYNSGVDVGWQEGYDAALNDIDREGLYQEGYDKGKREGYELGKRDHETYELDFPGVIDSYFDGVGRILVDSFGWEIFGINILGTLTALIVVAVLAWFIKKLKGF